MNDSPEQNNDLRFELITDTHETTVEDPLQFIRRKLRGRYRVTLLLALLLALCGSILGYTIAPVKYESTGLIQFKPALPTILYQSQENQPTPLFDSFVSAQATLILSTFVLKEALNDPAISDIDWPMGPEGIDALERVISVSHRRGEQVVSVTATHRNSLTAQTTVNAVLAAYDRTYNDPIRLNPTVREQKLVLREQDLQLELTEIGERILHESDQYGADTIKRLHQEKVQELIAIDQKLREINLIIRTLNQQKDPNMTGSPMLVTIGMDPIASLLQSENNIGGRSDLQEKEQAIYADLESYKGRFGDRHPKIRELRRRLAAVQIHLELRQGFGREGFFKDASKINSNLAMVQASIERFRELDGYYQAMHKTVRQEATELGNKSVTLSNMQEMINNVKIRLNDTRQALDVLRVESDRDESARVFIASMGELPVVPTTDRRQSLAVASALFGIGMAACLVVGIGIFDPRIRFAQELQAVDIQAQVISLIPDISVNSHEIDELAGLGVHQLRNLLELQREADQHGVYTITSPGRREGKTSLVLALGASFATTGRKTLIIDADVTRSGLTRELQMENLPGLCEAIGPVNNGGEIHETNNENLWALPVGMARNFDPRNISRDKLQTLIDAIRPRFDVIIFDTGSVLTSLEASLVSSVSDRVIMTVACNQHSEQVKASLERLRRIGAECTGLVFNMAPASDFDRRDWQVAQTAAHAAPLIPETPTNSRNLVGTLSKVNLSKHEKPNVPLRKAA